MLLKDNISAVKAVCSIEKQPIWLAVSSDRPWPTLVAPRVYQPRSLGIFHRDWEKTWERGWGFNALNTPERGCWIFIYLLYEVYDWHNIFLVWFSFFQRCWNLGSFKNALYKPRGFCSLHRGQDLCVLHQNGQYLRLHHVVQRGKMFQNLGFRSTRFS